MLQGFRWQAIEFPVAHQTRSVDRGVIGICYPISAQRIGMSQLTHFKQSQPETGAGIGDAASVVPRIINSNTP
jgi:hypothetical protein